MSIFLILSASIKAPAVARRPAAIAEADTTMSEETNGDVSTAEGVAPLNSAQRLAASTASTGQQSSDEPFALDAKYFTEMRVLNREVIAFLIKFVFFTSTLFRWPKFKIDSFVGPYSPGRC